MSQVSDATDIAGQAATVPAHTPAAPPSGEPVSLESIVPAEYKDKPWVQEIKDVSGLFKRFEDNHTALSRRPAGIPQDNAPEAEWDAFNKAAGVPEKPEDYDFSILDRDFSDQDKAFHESVRGILKSAGISKRQFAKLIPAFDEMTRKQAEAQEVAQKKSTEELDQQFDKVTNEKYGDRKQAIFDRARKFFEEYSDPNLKMDLAGLPNNVLVGLVDFVNNVYEKHVSEDTIPSGGGSVPGQTLEEKKAEGARLMASKEYQDPFHPEHARVRKKVDELFLAFNKT